MGKLTLSIMACAALIAGCETTVINFQKPTGTEMTINGGNHKWPARVEFSRPSEVGKSQPYPFTMKIPSDQGMIQAEGTLTVFAYAETEKDKLTENTFSLTTAQLEQLYDGKPVKVVADTPDSNQKMYQFVVGVQKKQQ